MSFEDLAQLLSARGAEQIVLTVHPSQDGTSARLKLDMADGAGQPRGAQWQQLPDRSSEADARTRVAELVAFLATQGFSVDNEDTYTVTLKRTSTPPAPLPWQTRLEQAINGQQPAQITLSKAMNEVTITISGQRLMFGKMTSDEQTALHEWLVAHGFTKTSETLDDWRYGEFTMIYERTV